MGEGQPKGAHWQSANKGVPVSLAHLPIPLSLISQTKTGSRGAASPAEQIQGSLLSQRTPGVVEILANSDEGLSAAGRMD